MVERAAKLTENTLIPLSLVATLIGGVFWLSQVYARGESTATTVDRMVTAVESINQRLSRIEGFMQKQVERDDE